MPEAYLTGSAKHKVRFVSWVSATNSARVQAAGTGSMSKVRVYDQVPQSRQIHHCIHHCFLHKAVCTRQALNALCSKSA